MNGIRRPIRPTASIPTPLASGSRLATWMATVCPMCFWPVKLKAGGFFATGADFVSKMLQPNAAWPRARRHVGHWLLVCGYRRAMAISISMCADITRRTDYSLTTDAHGLRNKPSSMAWIFWRQCDDGIRPITMAMAISMLIC